MITIEFITLLEILIEQYHRHPTHSPTLEGLISFARQCQGQRIVYEGTIPAPAPEKETTT